MSRYLLRNDVVRRRQTWRPNQEPTESISCKRIHEQFNIKRLLLNNFRLQVYRDFAIIREFKSAITLQ